MRRIYTGVKNVGHYPNFIITLLEDGDYMDNLGTQLNSIKQFLVL